MRVDLIAGLDPRSKLVAFLTVQTLLFIPGRQLPHVRLLAVALPLLVLLPFAGRSWRRWLRLLALASSLLAFLAASTLLRTGMDRPAPHLVILPMLGKSLLVFLSLALFILSEEPWRLLQGLRQLGLPRSAVVVLVIGYRFACQWQLELEAVQRAWRARNFSALSKRRRARYISGALPMLFERLFESGVHIHDAMVSRGFHGSLPAGRHLDFSRRDVAFLTLVALTATVIAIL
jgi:energy-coupling factor transporter transmembrane protein EcfT